MLRILSSFISYAKLPLTQTTLFQRNILTITSSDNPAKLPEKVAESLLIKREWAYPPFGLRPPPLVVPVYDIKTGMFTGKNIGI